MIASWFLLPLRPHTPGTCPRTCALAGEPARRSKRAPAWHVHQALAAAHCRAPCRPQVVAVGPGREEDGKAVKPKVDVGATVLYQKYSGTEVRCTVCGVAWYGVA